MSVTLPYGDAREFEGKVALVTGGSRGIGRAIALAFARLGCRVAICYRQSQEAAEAVCADARAAGGEMRAYMADVGQSDAARGLVNAVVTDYGRIDILVNNASVFPRTPVVDITDEEWEETLRSGLYSTFYCSRAVLPHMIEQGGGIIVNLGSIAGKRGSRFHAAYAAAKGGVFAFTRSLAKEAIPYGIRVNAVCPGRVETEIFGSQLDEAERERFLREAPIGRLSTPEEVASAVVFLASSASSYVVGESLDVDGGLVMD
ncbi:MAG: SDR family NAD(P)-dependent oxidoreductase [Nitrososphaerales archaeon]